MQTVDLYSINDGAALEHFKHSIAEVMENIDNPNYDQEATREITLKFTFKGRFDHKSGLVRIITKVKSTVKLPARASSEKSGVLRGKKLQQAPNPDDFQTEIEDPNQEIPPGIHEYVSKKTGQ